CRPKSRLSHDQRQRFTTTTTITASKKNTNIGSPGVTQIISGLPIEGKASRKLLKELFFSSAILKERSNRLRNPSLLGTIRSIGHRNRAVLSILRSHR